MKITHIVVHYSATYEDQNVTAADIDRMHKARGWKMIGYHWFIRRDGTVEPGRPESMVGAHVGGQNTGKIGVCWAGGLNRASGPDVGVDNRTDAQKEALIALIRDLLKRYPGAQVVGHRDLAATQCPGFDVRSWWAGVRKVKKPEPTPVGEGAPAKTPGIAEEVVHFVREGETWLSIAQMYGVDVGELMEINSAGGRPPKVGAFVILARDAFAPDEPVPGTVPGDFKPSLLALIAGAFVAMGAGVMILVNAPCALFGVLCGG